MATGINRSSKLPLYQQLYEIMYASFLRGEWKPGDMLPSEAELVDKYQVSRITVRQVLDRLVNEGLISRERGRGTFVLQPTLEQGMHRIISFTDDMRQRGIKPETRLLSSSLITAPQEIAERLQVNPDEELAMIKRLRLGNGEPLSTEESYLIHRYCPGILEHDFVSNSMRMILEREYDIHWSHARQVIRSVPSPRSLVKILMTRPNSAILYIERISFDQNNTPVEYLRLYHRGDRYALYNELRG